MDPKVIFLDVRREQMIALPTYRPPRTDEEVAATVRSVLEQRLGRPVEIGIAAESGVVRLSGRVATEAERRGAVIAARQVPGVWEVRDELVPEAAH